MLQRRKSSKVTDQDRGFETAVADRVLAPDSLLTQHYDRAALDPRLLQLFSEYVWRRRSRYARSWLLLVGLADLFLIPFDLLLNSTLLVPSIVIRGIFVSAVFAGLYVRWRKHRSGAAEGLSLILASATIMLCAGSLGYCGGEKLFERYLTGGYFTISSALISFPVDFRWTALSIVVSTAIYLGLLLVGPMADLFDATIVTGFYFIALLALTSARIVGIKSLWRSYAMKIRQARDNEEMARLNAELRLLADRDPLTGMANRRWMTQRIAEIWSDETIAMTGVAFIMVDIDHFKRLNDSCGHAFGDNCIQRVATTIMQTIRRDTDVAARYGGEEFLVVLTHADAESALAIAERIRAGIEGLRLANPGSPIGNIVTVSLGIAFAQDGIGPESITKWADHGLYEAKRCGRNRVCTTSVPASARLTVDAPVLDAIEMPAQLLLAI